MRKAVLRGLIAALVGSAAIGTTAATEPAGLRAGFAARTITPAGTSPAGWDFWVGPSGIWSEPFTDLNGNGYYDPGEPFIDDPANTLIDPGSAGKWDGCWTNAGFGGKGATGVKDDIWARAVVLSAGEDKVAMVSLDVVGFFYEEIERIRVELDERAPGHGIDKVIVSSTHTHEACDTMGLWGNPTGLDGKFPKWQSYIRARTIDAILEADATAADATVKVVTTEHLPLTDIRDSRPPVKFDPWLQAAQFIDDDGDVLGTIVNWSNHPEALWSRNREISSDFPHGTRTRLEEVYGGTAVYFSGSVGGLMTPGNQPPRYIEIGENVANAAIAALDGAVAEEVTSLDIASKEFFFPGDNYSLRALNAAGVFDKPTYTAGLYSGLLGDEFKTEMVSVRAGPMVFQTVPGELFPEIELGGYGRPECAEADTGRPYEPVIAEQYDGVNEDVHLFTLGLAQDELGYIVPGYDFWIYGLPEDDNPRPFVDVGVNQRVDPCGERHYEETVSASSVLAPIVACVAAELAGKDPWNDLVSYPACSPANTTVGPQGTNPNALLP